MKERPKDTVQCKIVPLEIPEVLGRHHGEAEINNPSSTKAKAFLNRCEGLSIHHSVLPDSQQIPLTLTLKSIILILQPKLHQNNRKRNASLQRIQDLLYIAKLLKILLEIFKSTISRSKQRFYKLCDKSLGISEKTYTSYQNYLKFHMKYYRFQHVPISFSKWRDSYPAVKSWFKSAACLELLPSDPHSELYWKSFDNISEVNANDSEVQILSVTSISGRKNDRLDNLFS
jgi:hypothetical protein